MDDVDVNDDDDDNDDLTTSGPFIPQEKIPAATSLVVEGLSSAPSTVT